MFECPAVGLFVINAMRVYFLFIIVGLFDSFFVLFHPLNRYTLNSYITLIIVY